jgi:hypothetical protein
MSSAMRGQPARPLPRPTIYERSRGLVRSWADPHRRLSDRTRGLIAIAGALAVLAISLVANGHNFRIVTGEAVVLAAASLLLLLRWMLALMVVIAVCVVVVLMDGGPSEVSFNPASLLVLFVIGGVALVGAARRQALGLGNVSAESVIEKLRAQLRIQGSVPPLPGGWHVDVEQRAAHGAAIAGDFVSCRVHDVGGDMHLDLVLVDVSGKGIEAGTRALLLSGAMGGLLGSVGPDDFLAEANNYLRRQSWAEGFASAVYVRVNLSSGLYSISSAGHLPALHLQASTSSWRMSDSKGMLLGIMAKINVRADYLTMRTGDALVLYTDGVVEDPNRDLSWGTDRLMGAAQALVQAGSVDKVARRLVDEVPTRLDDDRAIVVIWRDPV